MTGISNIMPPSRPLPERAEATVNDSGPNRWNELLEDGQQGHRHEPTLPGTEEIVLAQQDVLLAACPPDGASITVSQVSLTPVDHGASRFVDALLLPMQTWATGRLSFIYASQQPGQAPANNAPATGVQVPAPAGTGPRIPETVQHNATTSNPQTSADIAPSESVPRTVDRLGSSTSAAARHLAALVAPEWPERRFQFLLRDGHCEIRIRDYRLNEHETGLLIRQILKAADDGQIPIRRITVNGLVAWRQAGVDTRFEHVEKPR